MKGEDWSILKPAARAEEDSVILVNLSSCCKNFLNASYHLLLMLSRLGWKPGGFPALSCPTYNGVILDLFPVISASSSVSSAYSCFFFLIFFFSLLQWPCVLNHLSWGGRSSSDVEQVLGFSIVFMFLRGRVWPT